MREIKFRAWLKEESRMAEVSDISFIGEEIDVYGEEGCLEGWWGLNYIELMQYTGLKDKNGVEIYEGDIVEYKDFSGGLLLFKEQPKSKGVVKINLAKGIYLKGMGTFEGQKVEVIGNIYENPELLKGE